MRRELAVRTSDWLKKRWVGDWRVELLRMKNTVKKYTVVKYGEYLSNWKVKKKKKEAPSPGFSFSPCQNLVFYLNSSHNLAHTR